MDCPRCSATMSAHLGDASAIRQSCGGAWIPAAALVSRLGHVTGRDVADELATLLSTGSRVTALRSPGCTSEALRVVTLRAIEVESCPDCHGIFLDCGEVERLRGSRPAAMSGPGGVVLDLLAQLLASALTHASGA